MNVIIIHKLRCMTNKRSLNVSIDSESDLKPYNKDSKEMPSISIVMSQEEISIKKRKRIILKRIANKLKEERIIRVLIAILTSYTVFTLPHTVILSFWLFGAGDNLWEEDGVTFRLLTGTSSLLITFKYSLNFFLYCIASSDVFTFKPSKAQQKVVVIKIKDNTIADD